MTLLVAAIATACSPLSKESMKMVDELAPFGEIQTSPRNYVKSTVLWGGVIVRTTNKEDTTIIKVLQTDLDGNKRPVDPDTSKGRFLVRYAGFLDPVIYDKGREITVVGVVMGSEELPLGDRAYVYPVIAARKLYLWKRRVVAREHTYPFWHLRLR